MKADQILTDKPNSIENNFEFYQIKIIFLHRNRIQTIPNHSNTIPIRFRYILNASESIILPNQTISNSISIIFLHRNRIQTIPNHSKSFQYDSNSIQIYSKCIRKHYITKSNHFKLNFKLKCLVILGSLFDIREKIPNSIRYSNLISGIFCLIVLGIFYLVLGT